MKTNEPFTILVTPEVEDGVLRQFMELGEPHFEWIRIGTSDHSDAYHALLARANCLVTKNKDLTEEEYRIAGNLKLIQLPIAGYDKINLNRARKYGVAVANNGGANAISVSEHVFLLVLTLYRHLFVHHNSVLDGSWINLKNSNLEMAEKTMGIVGLGNIGKQVAMRARAFQMNVSYYDIRRPSREFEKEYDLKYKPFETLMRESDIVTFHVPLTSRTRDMINQESLGLMKPSALIINTARGEIQDESALYKVLSERRIMGAGLDVFQHEPLPTNSPLLTLDNVVLTPHAGPSHETRFRMVKNVVGNIVRFANGEPPLYLAVDYDRAFPE